jgi:hypothetical protein
MSQKANSGGGLRLSELDLPIDDNPDGTADRKQVLFFTKERRLGLRCRFARMSPRIARPDAAALRT